MTTINQEQNAGRVERIELERPSRIFDWMFKANHWSILVTAFTCIAFAGSAYDTLKEHGEKINAIENQIITINSKVDQVSRDTGYLSGRLDNNGHQRNP